MSVEGVDDETILLRGLCDFSFLDTSFDEHITRNVTTPPAAHPLLSPSSHDVVTSDQSTHVESPTSALDFAFKASDHKMEMRDGQQPRRTFHVEQRDDAYSQQRQQQQQQYTEDLVIPFQEVEHRLLELIDCHRRNGALIDLRDLGAFYQISFGEPLKYSQYGFQSIEALLVFLPSISMKRDARLEGRFSVQRTEYAESSMTAALCQAAAARIMSSAEIYGKLLQVLRDHQYYLHGLTYKQLCHAVPRLHRILIKTARRAEAPIIASPTFTIGACAGVRCERIGGIDYFSLDQTWLSTYFNREQGYNPGGNLVLQLVEHRLLDLIDNSKGGKVNTNEMCRIYEASYETFHFSRLGFPNFKTVLAQFKSISRKVDPHVKGRWYLTRSSRVASPAAALQRHHHPRAATTADPAAAADFASACCSAEGEEVSTLAETRQQQPGADAFATIIAGPLLIKKER